MLEMWKVKMSRLKGRMVVELVLGTKHVGMGSYLLGGEARDVDSVQQEYDPPSRSLEMFYTRSLQPSVQWWPRFYSKLPRSQHVPLFACESHSQLEQTCTKPCLHE